MPKLVAGLPVRHLYLLRHGQADYNSHNDALQGGLTALGREQAYLSGSRLAALPLTALHTSSMRRAAETAAFAARHHPGLALQTTELLWECLPSVPPEYADEWGAEIDAVAANQARLRDAFAAYFRPPTGPRDEHELIVAHGNVIRHFVARVLSADIHAWRNMGIHNCGLTTIQILQNGYTSVISFNDTGHLPDTLRTWL